MFINSTGTGPAKPKGHTINPLTTAEMNEQLRKIREDGQSDRVDLSTAGRLQDVRRGIWGLHSMIREVPTTARKRRYVVTPVAEGSFLAK